MGRADQLTQTIKLTMISHFIQFIIRHVIKIRPQTRIKTGFSSAAFSRKKSHQYGTFRYEITLGHILESS